MAVKNEPLFLETRMFKGEEPGLSAIGTELGVLGFDGDKFSFLGVVKGTGVSSPIVKFSNNHKLEP
ncbi:Uncharacterised protein [uncultured archaeon]|nr:Uncharacterised protein [uncultured archaeon]